MAIFLAIAAHKDPSRDFHIVGITCVNGNTNVDNVCVNVTRTLKAADALDVSLSHKFLFKLRLTPRNLIIFP